jgi:GTP cyclohydrolase II
VQLGYAADARQYTRAAEILHDLGILSVRLMTNSPQKIASLRAAGITIAGTQPLLLDPGDNDMLRRRYEDKIAQGHRLHL